MKILQVANFFKPIWEAGGVARSTYELSRHLVERGHDLTVYSTNWAYFERDLPTNRPVSLESMQVYYFDNLRQYSPVDVLPPIPWYAPFVARKEVKDFDIVHMNEYRSLLSVSVYRYAKKYGTPYVLQARGSLPKIMQVQRLKSLFDIAWGNDLLRSASRAIALNQREVDLYVQMGVEEDRIETIPNGVDLSLFENLPEKGTFRKMYGIGEDEEIILFLGRLNPIKGADLLIDAFSMVLSEWSTARLVIVGPDGGQLPALEQQIHALGLGKKILVTGPLFENPAKIAAYLDADIYVLPSMYETFPNSVLEANACGTPAIITDRCGSAEIFNGKSGYVVGYDRTELRDAILDLLRNPDIRKAFGKAGREMVFAGFGWDRIVAKVEKLYENVLAEDAR
jgi:glycosyltransferase involved in cell wall biosynthesis